MSREKIIQFNEILSSFLVQISPLVGSSYHNSFEQIVKYNSILPIEQYLVYALPLRDKILNRDESYFSDNNHQETHEIKDDNILNEILRLQNIYSKLDDVSKANVWDMFQAMLILGEEYIRMKLNK